jgi:hypothetical protein
MMTAWVIAVVRPETTNCLSSSWLPSGSKRQTVCKTTHFRKIPNPQIQE